MAFYEFESSGKGITFPDSFSVGMYRKMNKAMQRSGDDLMVDGYWRTACALGAFSFDADGVNVNPSAEFDSLPYRAATFIRTAVDDWLEPFLASSDLKKPATNSD